MTIFQNFILSPKVIFMDLPVVYINSFSIEIIDWVTEFS